MNIQKLKEGIALHKTNSPKTYDEDINITVPLLLLNRKMLDGISNILVKKYSIVSAEFDVLVSLLIGGKDDFTLSPTELYDRLIFSSSGMSKVIKRLNDKEYIVRIDNPEDKRSKLVKLTIKGRELLDVALKDLVKYECEYFKNFTKDEKNTFSKLLFKSLQGME